MHLSYSYQLSLGIALLPYTVDAAPTLHHLTKRAPAYDVLRGANFADPAIINVDGTSYAFGTVDGAGHEVPTASNPDFGNPSGWSEITESFSSLPGWAQSGTVWAPDVERLADGSFVMYYSPALAGSQIHCVGVARSTSVSGPYTDGSTAPWVCPSDQGGAIDASGFADSDGTRYVMYKIDGPAVTNGGYCASPDNTPSTPIMLQQVQADGYTKVGDPVEIWNNRGVIDHYQSEAPIIVRSDDGTYFLFYSTGCYTDSSYTTSYVTSQSVAGPYGNPQVLLKNGDYGLFGPGGADITFEGGQMVFHSLVNNDINQGRVMSTATVTLSGTQASIN